MSTNFMENNYGRSFNNEKEELTVSSLVWDEAPIDREHPLDTPIDVRCNVWCKWEKEQSNQTDKDEADHVTTNGV